MIKLPSKFSVFPDLLFREKGFCQSTISRIDTNKDIGVHSHAFSLLVYPKKGEKANEQ
jgi:hypothetical protein